VKNDLPYLLHISDSITAVQQYVAGGRESFMGSRLIQDAVIRNLTLVWDVIENDLPALKIETDRFIGDAW
jgi:uncharacterized protein with HEPN domain